MTKKLSVVFGTLATLILVVSLLQSCIIQTKKPPAENYTLKESQTIGSAGGKLTTDDFSLTVPSGAFDSEVKLELYVSSTDDPFGDDGISKTFRIEGLPDEYSQPLQVQIKYQGNLSGKSFIALGEEVFIRSLNTIETAYNLFPATELNGYLSCELPAPDQEKGTYARSLNNIETASNLFSAKASNDYLSCELLAPKQEKRTYDRINNTVQAAEPGHSRTTLQAITGRGTYTSDKKHFEIIYPAFVANEVSDLADFLEEAYSKFQGMGFSYASRTKWPISVTVKDLGSEVYGFSVCSIRGDNYGYMEFNADKMADLQDMRITAGHEFFHLVQALYDSRNRFSKAKFASPHYWLDEATAVWSEEKFSDTPNYCSPIRKGHEMAPFSGMQAGADENAQHYGYGMSAMIKYLVNRYGEGILVKMYGGIRNSAHPIRAISSSTDPFAVWWDTFLRDYVLGKVYADVSPALWLGNSSGNFEISSASDTLKTFSGSYPDLSAKLYRVDLKYPGIDSNAAINFKVTGGAAHVTVFKYKPSSIEYLGSATDDVTISDVKKLTDDKWNLLALVSNCRDVSPYTGTTNIELKVSVTKCDGNYSFVVYKLPTWFNGRWDVSDFITAYLTFSKGTITAYHTEKQTDYYFEKVSGTYDGNGNITFTFTFNWESSDRSSGEIYTGTFTGKYETGSCNFKGTASGKVRNYRKMGDSSDYDKTTDFTSKCDGYFGQVP